MLYPPNPENPYVLRPVTNAVFTFYKGGILQLDPDTGNYIPVDAEPLLCEATMEQKKDPNLVLQPGIDYNLIYFEGYLVNPKTEPLASTSKNVPAVINNIEGVFDFLPVFDKAEAVSYGSASLTGQKVIGYFRVAD